MRVKLYIRADGTNQIGLGHLTRCLALAHMLKEEYDIFFVCKEAPANIIMDIKNYGFSFLKISEEEEFFDILEGNEIVVIDHYGADEKYEEKIKYKQNIVVCIDDIHNRIFKSDLIINHAPMVIPQDYKTRSLTQFALGLEYALLRPAFLGNPVKREPVQSENVLICFGGADFKNLTLDTLKVVLEFNAFKNIIVVTGGAYLYLEELTSLLNKDDRISHYHSVDEKKMAELISKADLTIVPSSGVLLEAIAVGNKIISGMYIENQKNIFTAYKSLSAFISAEDFSEDNLRLALKMSLEGNFKPSKLIDGKSNLRLLKVFRQLIIDKKLLIRKAEEADLEITYKWATDKKVRAFSFNTSDIKFDEHSSWFLNKINSENCFYYIAELNNKLVGSIRFDIKDEVASISYLVDPVFHHNGYGISLLKQGMLALCNERQKNIKKVVGYVLPQNLPSLRTFDKLGFSSELENDNYKYTKLIDYANW